MGKRSLRDCPVPSFPGWGGWGLRALGKGRECLSSVLRPIWAFPKLEACRCASLVFVCFGFGGGELKEEIVGQNRVKNKEESGSFLQIRINSLWHIRSDQKSGKNKVICQKEREAEPRLQSHRKRKTEHLKGTQCLTFLCFHLHTFFRPEQIEKL